MTKRMFFTSFTVLVLLATASMVMAQPGQGGGQRGQGGQGGPGRATGPQPGGVGGFQVGGGGAMGILAIAEARTALGVTEDQMAKLRPTAPAPGTTPAAPANLTAEERAARTAERAAAARKNLEDTLTKDQVTKLDIMVFQRAGGLNSLNPPAAPNPGAANAPRGGAGFGGAQVTLDSLRTLNLTAEQTKKFEEAQTALRAATPIRQGGGNAGGPPAQPTAEELAARQKANADFRAAVNALLTDAQKAKAEELMKDVPTFLRPQPRTPGAGGANAAPGAGAGNRGAGGTGGANRGAGGGRSFQNN